MKLGYTEFSFGYAFTENLIRSSATGPKSAPVFPNLVQEALKGYDVHIDLPGVPLFFQYKLPELMMRDTAREIAKHKLRGIYAPFFRMPLMPSGLSRQHELLIKLETRFPGAVLYAAPRMHDGRAFNRAYLNREVHRKSIFFSPKNIGPLPDPKAHSIAYRDGLPYAWLCSQPREIAATTFEGLEQAMLTRLTHPGTLGETGNAMRELIRSVVSEPMRSAEQNISEQIRARRASLGEGHLEGPVEDILVAREMVRIDLGVELVIAQRRS